MQDHEMADMNANEDEDTLGKTVDTSAALEKIRQQQAALVRGESLGSRVKSVSFFCRGYVPNFGRSALGCIEANLRKENCSILRDQILQDLHYVCTAPSSKIQLCFVQKNNIQFNNFFAAMV